MYRLSGLLSTLSSIVNINQQSKISGFGRSASELVRSGVDPEIPPGENRGTRRVCPVPDFVTVAVL